MQSTKGLIDKTRAAEFREESARFGRMLAENLGQNVDREVYSSID